ncbi:bacteriophage abortive infection AbiH family protein [Pedobacter sp. 22226]|uniref:bacteriophage abortive infection AbiH family protein n=1 Tax=Pedobacter sp. 22226 TaxID=3453894 RepID=UPI003F8756BE
MHSKILYIIGNGFDLHHGIPSSYWHFRNYVNANNKELFHALEKYFDPEQLWSDFESALADLDTDHILEEGRNYYVDYGAEDWSDAYHHDYQYEIGERIKLVTTELKKNFTEWILSLDIPGQMEDMLKINREAIFLNFNYTPTLSRLYKVDKSNTTYIHNEAQSEDSDLLLGHGINPGPLPERGDEGEDIRITEGQEIIDGYFLASYKPVEKIIAEKQDFFDLLTGVAEVNIYGHSMSQVDIPYFAEIIKRLDLVRVKWRVSYYNEGEDAEKLAALLELGVPEENITVDKLGNFDTGQLKLL